MSARVRALLLAVLVGGCASTPADPHVLDIEFEHCAVMSRLPDLLRCSTRRIPVPAPAPLPPLRPLPSDEHLARWESLLLVIWLGLGLCPGCALLPAPPAVAPALCSHATCRVMAVP
jgi:hypothetical protein